MPPPNNFQDLEDEVLSMQSLVIVTIGSPDMIPRSVREPMNIGLDALRFRNPGMKLDVDLINEYDTPSTNDFRTFLQATPENR